MHGRSPQNAGAHPVRAYEGNKNTVFDFLAKIPSYLCKIGKVGHKRRACSFRGRGIQVLSQVSSTFQLEPCAGRFRKLRAE